MRLLDSLSLPPNKIKRVILFRKEDAKIPKRVATIKNDSIMKNLTIILTLIFSLTSLTSCEKETILSEQDIPADIKSYLSTHFQNCSISKAIKENDEKDEMYEISLSCDCKLEFNRQKDIIDIDCITKLPDSVIPSIVLSYVNSNYPGNNITGWEIKDNSLNVDLNNGITLVFNMQGDFLHLSD